MTIQQLAALIAFAVAVPLVSLYVFSEWRDSYGTWAAIQAVLIILLNSSLVALLHWGAWSLVALAWRHFRGSGG